MTIFESYTNTLQKKKEIENSLNDLRHQVKDSLLNLVDEKGSYQTAQALSLETGLPSSTIAKLLWDKRRGEVTTITKYARIRPDGSVDMAHFVEKKYDTLTYGRFHDDWGGDEPILCPRCQSEVVYIKNPTHSAICSHCGFIFKV